ncbi:uncharacterized membrane protein YidH (DUF202 family) [Constrictibacter sp. MBR-5]|jgi:uncharacterized membrane protein YidH (DUF202 family)|uniref:hypothetical protein n=1 Tax=Constrictibacter sp. MBR-5 TaxID=3156467 RepID=UPI00339974DC
MAIRTARFLALLLTALALIPGGAHLAELPGKMALDREAYFTVQQIYAGWSHFGILLIGALLTTLALALLLYRRAERPAPAFLAFLLVAINLAVFFVCTFPANQSTGNWTMITADWAALRLQWEYSHAANALVMLAAFVCLLFDTVRRTDWPAPPAPSSGTVSRRPH